jgi:N-acylneuraminate cytidylyltransferase
LAGKPLIAYAIEAARAVSLIDRIVVSTDDPEIAQVSRQWGAEVPFMRPAELASDDSPEWLAWQHAIRALEQLTPAQRVDILVSAPTTSPLRAPGDIEACIQLLLDSRADVVITVTPARRSPYFNMVAFEAGYVRLVNASPANGIARRQDAPAVFDITTVAYAARRDYVLQASSLLEGKVKAVIVPESRALDIDSEMDLKFAELLMAEAPARS